MPILLHREIFLSDLSNSEGEGMVTLLQSNKIETVNSTI